MCMMNKYLLCSGIIINKRLQYIDMLNKFSKSIHNDISCNKRKYKYSL